MRNKITLIERGMRREKQEVRIFRRMTEKEREEEGTTEDNNSE